MSFVGTVDQGKSYAPGYFLAHEECVRKTKEIAQNSALVVTRGDGAKVVPGGTAYPTNDGSAVGIVYEDVDVTTGNMPGSVVMSGVVYEDRLAQTGYSYSSVTVGDYVSPKEEGWYESDGEVTPTYTLSTDTKASSLKTYYAKSGASYNSVTVGNFVSPKEEGWYESDGQNPATYTASTDTTASGVKTYYAQSAVKLAGAAKSALQALGFVFLSDPSVTRPY